MSFHSVLKYFIVSVYFCFGGSRTKASDPEGGKSVRTLDTFGYVIYGITSNPGTLATECSLFVV